MIGALILTKNEEKHLERCLSSIVDVVDTICVIDCGSNDRTMSIAESYNASVIYSEWVNYATQFNFGLSKLPENVDWVLRIDADEYIDATMKLYIQKELPTFGNEINGVSFSRLMNFLGRPIRYGGMYPVWQLRLFRRKFGCCENRWMDEHIAISSGNVIRGKGVITDYNLNTVTWWIDKHNGYASREAVDILCFQYPELISSISSNKRMDKQASLKRGMKKVYSLLPLGFRPLVYFIYRYFLLFGFLDGRRGAMFHFLQGFWYRFLVDTKVYEVKRYSFEHSVDVKEAIKQILGIEL